MKSSNKDSASDSNPFFLMDEDENDTEIEYERDTSPTTTKASESSKNSAGSASDTIPFFSMDEDEDSTESKKDGNSSSQTMIPNESSETLTGDDKALDNHLGLSNYYHQKPISPFCDQFIDIELAVGTSQLTNFEYDDTSSDSDEESGCTWRWGQTGITNSRQVPINDDNQNDNTTPISTTTDISSDEPTISINCLELVYQNQAAQPIPIPSSTTDLISNSAENNNIEDSEADENEFRANSYEDNLQFSMETSPLAPVPHRFSQLLVNLIDSQNLNSNPNDNHPCSSSYNMTSTCSSLRQFYHEDAIQRLMGGTTGIYEQFLGFYDK